MSIARRLGVPEAACAAAEAALTPDARQLREVLAHLHASQTTLDCEQAMATTEREQLTALRQRQQALVTELEEKKQRLDEELERAKHYVHTLRREGRTVTRPCESPSSSFTLTASGKQQELTSSPLHQQEAATSVALRIGDEVEAQAPHIRGKMVALRRDRARS